MSLYLNLWMLTFISILIIIELTSQLKHCSRQVHDILIPLIKNLEVQPAQHLLCLVSSLELNAHNEQVWLFYFL